MSGNNRRGSVLWKGLVFFIPIFFLLGFASKGEAQQPNSPSCNDLLPLVWYVEKHSRPRQTFPVSLEIGKALMEASRTSRIPLYLLVAVAQEESSFNPEAVNWGTQDYGLFQVHFPFWQKYFKKKQGKSVRNLSPSDLMEISANTQMASDILSYDLTLSKDDFIEMLGRYSGRKGAAEGRYVQHIFQYSLEFQALKKKNAGICSKE